MHASNRKRGNCSGHIRADEAEKLSINDVLKRLGTSPEKGLTEAEAKRRLQTLGPNEIPEEKPNPIIKFLSYFWGPIPWMIEAALIISWYLRDWIDFWIIFALLVVNGVVGFWEEHKAENVIEYLKKRLAHMARVLRDGKWKTIEARLLVPGDIVRLRLGDLVPADIKIISGRLYVNQSALTGESLPVEKGPGDVAYASSLVVRGEAVGVVVATGLCTFFGKTVELVQKARTVSKYQKMVLKVGYFLIVFAVVLIALTDIVELARGARFLSLLKFSLVLLVAAIPAALPAVLSITMAIGAYELAKKQAIVTRLVAVEELAAVDVLCADKTGTLTKNRLTAGEPVALKPYNVKDVVLYAALASRPEDQDPIDIAVFDLVKKLRLDSELAKYKVLEFKPFDPETKRTEAVVRSPDGRILRAAKGAPQVIASLVGDKTTAETVAKIVDDYAEKGYRMIGVAYGENNEWKYVGLIPLYDPPREDAAATVKELKRFHVRVKMITGDHVAIAKMIARLIGIGSKIFPISLLKRAPPEKQRQLVEEADGFAEVLPEDKYMIVTRLQENGHTVAMTGDGVNDAPALKKADVGIAVANATDAARAAADIVLLAPGISVIRDALFTARKIFRRMYSYVVYRITETIRVLIFIVLAILLLHFYPITPAALVLLALLNDIPILAIAYDNVRISRRPERWNMRLIIELSLLLGLTGVVSSFILIWLAATHLGLDPRHHLAALQTLVFLKLAVAGHLTIFVTRTEGPLWSIRPGKLLFWSAVATKAAATIIAVTGIPGAVAPIPAWMAGFLWLYALAWMLVSDQLKVQYYKRYKQLHVVL